MRTIFAVLALTVLLTACFHKTKDDLIQKAEGVETKQQLRKVLGDPDGVDKLGPIEKWTYKASDGTVIFPIIADKVGPQRDRSQRDRSVRGSAGQPMRNRTGWPVGVPRTSSSRMTTVPRTIVPFGQPRTVLPANGVQPHLLAIQSSVISRCSPISTRAKSAS